MHPQSSARLELSFPMKMEIRKEITKHEKSELSILMVKILFFGGIPNLDLIEIESTFILTRYLMEGD
ncbi:MAG: hypothetical protein EBU46_03700 [Nitrosomonadaceae bacterium]|nr:hypothetical protein [Nitrosomonadaceae bacterium]